MGAVLGEALGDILRYGRQMLPGAWLALLLFLLLIPWRRKRLARSGLVSPPLREGALLLFLLFCAGLAALTVFPSNFWAYLLEPERWPQQSLLDFYPTAQEVWSRLSGLPQELPWLLTPFPLGVAWHFRNYWSAFLFLGNIGMFLPIGFFPALLGRRPRWWKAFLSGFCASLAIETIQLFIGRGTDLDDLILNTAGALCGYWLYKLFQRLLPRAAACFNLQERGNAPVWKNVKN